MLATRKKKSIIYKLNDFHTGFATQETANSPYVASISKKGDMGPVVRHCTKDCENMEIRPER